MSDKWVEIKNIEKVFLRGNEIIVTGSPDDDDANHSCDQMGCSSVEHILLRGYVNNLEKGYTPQLQEILEGQLTEQEINELAARVRRGERVVI